MCVCDCVRDCVRDYVRDCVRDCVRACALTRICILGHVNNLLSFSPVVRYMVISFPVIKV